MDLKKYKNSLFYLGVTGGFSALIYWIVKKGKALENVNELAVSTSSQNSWYDFIDSMQHNFKDPLAILLAQIVTIILVARLFGWIFK
ncbi:MAG: cation/H(+) antiporter, partial [Bacteroidetes bacterium]|nr:cation/H(+) antiporter [Bacteroidota bacterium]